MNFYKSLLLQFLLLSTITGFSQKKNKVIKVIILNEKNRPFPGVTVELLSAEQLTSVKAGRTDKKGVIFFSQPAPGRYVFNAKSVGYEPHKTTVIKSPFVLSNLYIKILPSSQVLKEVNICGKTPVIQHIMGKVILNVDASITNAGTTVLELLEKSPGVMIDKDGNISLQGKKSVLIMIDEKPTYLSGSDLNNLLSSMSSSNVSQIELITNPSAKYDASGNGGIINIKTKKNTQEGFNGSLNTIGGWSRNYKNNNSLSLNYKKGKFNTYLTTSYNTNNNYTDIYANRVYLNQNTTATDILEQETAISNLTHYYLLKTGIDLYASKATTLGFSISGTAIKRTGNSNAIATWKKLNDIIDSTISTTSSSIYKFRNGAANLNFRHSFSRRQNLSVDLDALSYRMNNNQVFTNEFLMPNGYKDGTDIEVPSTIRIFSVKADHVFRINRSSLLESGFKSSKINTDNVSEYINFNNLLRAVDLNRSNHFIYKENINALYTSFQYKSNKINTQLGVRYEYTDYNASQHGTRSKPDSSFSRNYGNFFPSGYLSYQADSLHMFSITASRRIDRPAYQKLNPFTFIVNKYTIQKGNPYIRPQYSWNLEFSHRYAQLITTTLSYNMVRNYFSQLFLSEGTGVLIYTDGNVGIVKNLGLSVSLQFPVTKWWSFNGQGNYNYKNLKGYRLVNYQSSINQFQFNVNNQFNVSKTILAELSGFYITRARNDLQELLYPTGQVSAGVSKTIFKGRGSLRFSARDVFFTQAMEGLTDFSQAQEYFKLTRDSRLFFLSFSYRFGKSLKTTKRSNGGATDEMNRAGAVN